MLSACFFGFATPYEKTLALMHELHEQVVDDKISEQLMLLEHEPVITITRQHEMRSIKTSEEKIKNCGIALCVADRGGDATFHGPGQLVGYPLMKVLDIGNYIRSLESALLRAVHRMGIKTAMTIPGFTGIWIRCDDNGRTTLKKLVAIGVGVKNGVSKHGFAINIDIDWRRYTEHIVPCGLQDRGVITLYDLFYKERLEYLTHSAIVRTVSESISETFSLMLTWKNAKESTSLCGDKNG